MVLIDSLDQILTGLVNAGAGRMPSVDNAVRVLTDWNLFRAGWLGCVLISIWFTSRDAFVRLKLLAGIGGIILATGLSKALQSVLPVHPRPFVMADELGYHMPANLFTHWGDGNSFPSDTSTAYFALAAVVYSLSRRLGIAAFAWVAIVIAMPRIYLLYHWPSDIVAGAALGIATVTLVQHYRHNIALLLRTLEFEQARAALFYPLFFLAIYEIVDSFHALEYGLQHVKTLARMART